MNYAAPMAEHMTAADKRVVAWLEKLEKALTAGDADAAAALFADECYWRDLVTFTWNLSTQESKGQIAEMLKATLADVKPHDWRLDEPATEADGVTEGWFTFETSVFRGKGLVRLKGDLAWTLLTAAEEIIGHEEPGGFRREKSVEHGVHPDRKSWLERRHSEEAELGITRMPYVVIVGGGQGGIGLGARLKRLGVPFLILDKHPRPGDHWRKRYKSLHLHDPVWYDHLPYIPFPDHWPVFAAKDKIGDWLESYTKVMELNYWSNAECTSAKFDEANKEWTIEVEREGHPLTLKAKQMVLATGMSAVPNMPTFPGMADFRGISHHSSRHPGGDAYKGMKAVVIGSNNSAHDVCGDFYEHGADVTMVQRSSTHIATSEAITDIVLGSLYSEQAVQNGVTTNRADMTFASVPYKIMHTFHIPVYEEVKRRYADLYDRLRKVGFMLDFGDDESGLFMKYLRRGSGYYIDVGASELIADGKIKLKSGVDIERITPTGVKFVDGTELPADIIVYATGYSSMNGWAAKLISQDVADKVGKCWGLGSDTRKDPGPWEGELRNMWKPTQQEALWFHGGNLHQSRHYSLYLALQLRARELGIPTPVYKLASVNHKG